jgi:hypothetical protein
MDECWSCGVDLSECPPERDGPDRYCRVCEAHWVETEGTE